MLALLPVICAILGGQSAGVALAGLGIAGWVGVASDLVNMEPTAVALVGALHPAVAAVVKTLSDGLSAEAAGAAGHAVIHGPQYHGGPK